MTLVLRTDFTATERTVGMPRGAAVRPASMPAKAEVVKVEEGYRHQDIDSLKALGLAIFASVILTGLLWTVS